MAIIQTTAAPSDYKRRMALELLKQGSDTAPIAHWTQGAARMLQSALGGYEMYQADEKDKESAKLSMSAPGLPQLPNAGTPAVVSGAERIATELAPRPMIENKSPIRPAMDAAPVTGSRPGGPVMPSAKVWGDAEAEATGLYEKPANTQNLRVAQALEPKTASAPNTAIQPNSVSIPPDVGAYIQRLLANPATVAQGQALYSQYAKPRVPEYAPLGDDSLFDKSTGRIVKADVSKGTTDTRNYDRYVEQETAAGRTPKPLETFMTDQRKAGAQNTVISSTVNPVLKGIGEGFVGRLDAARNALPQIEAIHDARRSLDQGMITGQGADMRLLMKKTGALFNMGDDEIANTETFRASLGRNVLSQIKALGANPSNSDREYIDKISGGNIALDEKSIRRILDIQERAARSVIKRANSEGKLMLGAQPDEFKQMAPLMNIEEPGEYMPASRAPSPDDIAAELRRRGIR